ncbi:MAG: hypothetical protein QOF33_652 [Thermomicrobiales bacterium]|jgi:lipopolysaccharide/colanic/teichoic acid biosynthesis glycosyltransferase|nr:hypothetical protein [Thermomicrobiales bacterium]
MVAIRNDLVGRHSTRGVTEGTLGDGAIVRTVVLESSSSMAEFAGAGTGREWGLQGPDEEVGVRFRPALDSAAKRGFDVVVAGFLLCLFLPLWVLIPLAIGMTSPGPILFRQQRCGRQGRTFTCYKFRTMVLDAERRLREDARLSATHAGQWKLHDDPRVTTVGRWLRTTSLDELPQLWNVLRGQMSLVGPRPVQPQELASVYGALAETVTSVKPGVTGLWQVSGRSLLSYEERITLDVTYVYRRGFWYDLRLILRTIPAVLGGKGAV